MLPYGSVRHVISLLLLGVSLVWANYDLSEKLAPRGDLGINVDWDLATSGSGGDYNPKNKFRRNWSFNSHVVFKDTVEISDAQLVGMTAAAYKEMLVMIDEYQFSKNARKRSDMVPSVMVGLYFDNEIIFASSQRGQKSFYMLYGGGSETAEMLKQCQATFLETTGKNQPQHRTQAKCGEVVAALLFERLYPGRKVQDAGARVVAVQIEGIVADTIDNPDAPVRVVPPCPDESLRGEQWGCNLFVDKLGLEAIEDDERESFDDLIGDIEKTENLSVMQKECAQ